MVDSIDIQRREVKLSWVTLSAFSLGLEEIVEAVVEGGTGLVGGLVCLGGCVVELVCVDYTFDFEGKHYLGCQFPSERTMSG